MRQRSAIVLAGRTRATKRKKTKSKKTKAKRMKTKIASLGRTKKNEG